MRFALSILLLIFTLAGPTLAAAPPDSLAATGFTVEDEPAWALAAAYRSATIPFAADENRVTSFIPFVFFDGGGLFYAHGLEGGLRFYRPGRWQFSGMGRIRFFDIPTGLQTWFSPYSVFYGLQGKYSPGGPWHLDLEALSDFKGHEVVNARLGGFWKRPRVWYHAYLQAQYKTPATNSHYYGLNLVDVTGGVELQAGASVMAVVTSNLFVFARGVATLLDPPARNVSFVDKDLTYQGYLGFGLKNDRTRSTPSVPKATRYLRLSHGWVTYASLSDIFSGKVEPDPDNHQMTSVFYGHPLSDTLLGLPLQVYLHGGLGWHWENQKHNIQEFVIAVKVYYTIPLPVRLRPGLAEGWSYVTAIPFIEETEITAKGYQPSPLMNYLDFSLDVKVGDLFGWIGAAETLDRMWAGVGLHHRSAIYEISQQFGRIKGGSNVRTIYLQYDF
jgi:outer membrane protein